MQIRVSMEWPDMEPPVEASWPLVGPKYAYDYSDPYFPRVLVVLPLDNSEGAEIFSIDEDDPEMQDPSCIKSDLFNRERQVGKVTLDTDFVTMIQPKKGDNAFMIVSCSESGEW